MTVGAARDSMTDRRADKQRSDQSGAEWRGAGQTMRGSKQRTAGGRVGPDQSRILWGGTSTY